MKKVMQKIGVLATVLLVAGVSFGQSVRAWQSEDSSPALRIYNNSTSNGVFQGSNTVVWITSDTLKASVGTNSFTNISDFASIVANFTNAAGKKNFQVDYNCSLAGDACWKTLLATTKTVSPGTWGTAFVWDTSTCLFFSLYFPGPNVGGSGNAGFDWNMLDVYGNIGGSGNLTIDAYSGGVKFFERVFVSPLYIPDTQASSSTNLMRTDEVGPGQLSLNGANVVRMPIGYSEDILVRANRATTATTGGIGAVKSMK